MKEGNLLEGVLANTADEDEIYKFLVDMPKHKEDHPFPSIPPNPSTFSKEALAARQDMEWLHAVDMVLYYPDSPQLEDQRVQLNTLKDNLKTECIQLPQGFCPAFPEGYNEYVLALDTETTGLDTRILYDYDGNLIIKTQIVGICLAPNENKGYYLPVQHTGEDGIPNWDPQVMNSFLDELHEEFTMIYHNAQYDREIMAINGVTKLRPWPYFFDTQLLDFFLDVNNKAHGLKAVSAKLAGRKMIEIGELFVESGLFKKADLKHINITFDRLPATNAYVYGASDATNTYAIFKHYASLPEERNMFFKESVPLTVDHRNSDVLRNMYRMGLPVNFDYYMWAGKDAIFRKHALEKAIYEYIGRHFDIGSPAQLSKLLFEEYNIPVLPNMKRGKPTKANPDGLYSTAEDVLDALQEKFPEYIILNYVVQYRKLGSILGKILLKCLCNSYVDALVPNTRVFLQYNQTIIPTGRLASSSSNGKERVTVKESAKTGRVTYRHASGAWSCGFNSQGINNPRYKLSKAKRIKKINEDTAGVNLHDPYPKFVRDELVKNCSFI